MEEFITALSIGDDEEETIYLGMESSDQEISFANCFMGSFLTSRVVNFQAMRTMLALLNRPVECNEVYKLECSGFREASDNSPSPVCAERHKSLYGFYGAPEEKHREALWNMMQHLNDYPNVPQLMIGDFNEISYSSEKNGELVRSERQMRGFRDALVDCSLTDLGYCDHCRLPVNTNMDINSSRVWHFKFEDTWLMEDSCESEVKKLWAASVVLVPSRLRKVGLGLDK
ncbi:hypothetical protein Golob_023989 [Gossypium lobatum]|uniref:Endonuclease/exonuclease/phosphatase domain-containing protein n=1 Tax=Gossypium lobatum TaxID=34289 RepID=A0A7J8NJG3_9ROSI|nr:hypothetical protein [Gossypium lobatum]